MEYNEVGRSDTFTNNIPPVAGATQEYMIAGLKVGTRYQIRLRAQNRSQGYGLWSEWLFKETMAVPGREPSPAVSKVADPMVEAGDKMLMVSWTEPASEKSITHYMLDYKTASATKWMAKPMNVTDMKYTIDGLINGTAYLVRVRAVDSAGNMGEWSDNGSGTPMAGDTDPVPVPDPVPALPDLRGGGARCGPAGGGARSPAPAGVASWPGAAADQPLGCASVESDAAGVPLAAGRRPFFLWRRPSPCERCRRRVADDEQGLGTAGKR